MGGHLSHLERTSNTQVLNASCGPIMGNIYKHDTKIVDGYLGIPFAKPPIGELRFKKPEAAEVWTDVKQCVSYGPRCPPSGSFPEMVSFEKPDIPDEKNCLTLNVFSLRQDTADVKLPVMVYIHGGGFELSSSRDYDDYSLSGSLPLKNVVLVTINYRLGVLGFLSTGGDLCRGNFALWDQTLALKWVQTHIHSFGGDPSNVTILGQSAGGASVDLLSISPHSRDLFHRVIPMSGTGLCEFAVRKAENHANLYKEYAKHLGYEGKNSADLLAWYTAQPIENISKMNGFVLPTSGILTHIPNMDGDFFPKPLDELRKEAPKKDVMIGVAELEGLLFAFCDPTYTTADDALKKGIAMYYKDDIIENYEDIRNKIYEFYTKNVDTNNEDDMKKILIDFVGDALFNNGVISTAQSSANHGNNVWFYVFDYYNPNGFGALSNILPFTASTHCTDLRYILGEGLYSNFEPNDEELKMIDHMTEIYSNFAKYGNPNTSSTDWEQYNPEKPERHYRISYENGGMRDEYQRGRWSYFENIRKQNKNYQSVVYGIEL